MRMQKMKPKTVGPSQALYHGTTSLAILWRRGLTKLSGLAHTSLELEISLPQPLEYQPVYFSFSTRGTWCLG